MPVVYALVARASDEEVLAQHATVGAARGLATVAMESWRTYKDPSDGETDDDLAAVADARPDERFAVMCDNLTFTVLTRGGFVFVVVADEACAGRGIPGVCAQRVSDAWMERLGEVGLHAKPAVLQRAFGGILKRELAYCESHAGELSRVAAVQNKVDEVKGILIANVENVVRCMEQLDGVQKGAAGATEEAAAFREQGAKIRSRLRCTCGLKLCLVVAAVLIAVAIASAVCFGTSVCHSGAGGGGGAVTAAAPAPPPATVPAEAAPAGGAPRPFGMNSLTRGTQDTGGVLRGPMAGPVMVPSFTPPGSSGH